MKKNKNLLKIYILILSSLLLEKKISHLKRRLKKLEFSLYLKSFLLKHDFGNYINYSLLCSVFIIRFFKTCYSCINSFKG